MDFNENSGAAGLWARTKHSSFLPFGACVKSEYSLPAPKLLTNNEEFVCSICEMFLIEEQGVMLRGCRHNFCRPCLKDAVLRSEAVAVSCPLKVERCDMVITHNEIQALLTADELLRHNLKPPQPRKRNSVRALLALEENDYVENRIKFECQICLSIVKEGDGLVLKNCLHEYCKVCLSNHIEHSDELEVPCPYVAENGARCEGIIQDRELRSLISPAVFSAHLVRSLTQAEAVIKNSVHCKTADCPGWVEVEGDIPKFTCLVCNKENCIKCKAVHEGKTCEDYDFEINGDARKARENGLTNAQLQELLRLKQAMPCPGELVNILLDLFMTNKNLFRLRGRHPEEPRLQPHEVHSLQARLPVVWLAINHVDCRG